MNRRRPASSRTIIASGYRDSLTGILVAATDRSRLEEAQRVEVRRVTPKARFELRAQLVGVVDLQVVVVNDDAAVRGDGDRVVDRRQSLREQRIVTIRAKPALPVEAVGDVELRPRVAASAPEGGAGLDELVAAKECEAVGESGYCIASVASFFL